MKAIQGYKKETLEKLKQWITEMNARGHEQYYEIFIDGVRVVRKTNDTSCFDAYLTWLDSETQLIKVLTYNTQASHRSKPFEFRTNKYVEAVNYKEQAEELLKRNEELIKRLSDAESYIQNLETELENRDNKKSGFDLQSILSDLGTLTSQYPGLADNLGGLSGVFNTAENSGKKQKEEYEARFRKKKNNDDSNKKETSSVVDTPVNTQTNEKDAIVFKTDAKLNEDEAAKMYELMQFFCDKREYIKTVYEMLIWEKGKDAA